MKDTDLARRGLVLLGCGKMGSAMLEGWLARDLPPSSVTVIDPNPTEWLQNSGVRVNDDPPEDAALVLIAVKPQLMSDALIPLQPYGNNSTVFLSVAAGVGTARFEELLGKKTPIIRAMPNTPAAIGKGITAIIGNAHATEDHIDQARLLLSAVGEVAVLEDEAQMDAVTGVSGSGPAYVFHMIECLAAAGEAQGLSPDLALKLARATVAGAGALAQETGTDPAELRRNVTSPNGTTQAGLEVLMDEKTGLPPLMRATVKAAADRSRELGQ
ncbi:pyrroline-5-carboxylate reductase [Roseivivax halotolerans]|uniref:Pyrroline-5-carboxylate reductase n=1 Tax=Roseivivax halotolerans TaxID=93684 RepID=A0A1I5XZA6_9RHOB|nr:pyrroline-5-carboxylate reductase [Roseivivax halotolerans]SFQ37283.1 pyrroline-5-carboxylate reductase [Roseivivax halotolerans]